ncbi:twin-arginine translocase subunit TatC [Natronospirillum operosum]|uniref:Sec-independent protein translocase protein TatC n=1 Tax=Natronospirillum operosum TaxID=2759953 RepID=A0A4Z0WEA3_9GAMM|nr:twin-arginine translocase subunit TatC [Natronospirillum operosum]TGG93261.1 twin-arginine translocase subunit TatC [Natronospirillum operosum]
MTNPQDVPQSLIDHLKELRSRLLRCVIIVLALFGVLYMFSNELYGILSAPLRILVEEQAGQIIATGVASPFLVPFKLSFVAAVMLGMPFILYQLWAFVAPALYLHERRLMMPLFISSVVLFYLGVLFTYFVVMPLVFGFFTTVGPDMVNIMPDIAAILDFSLKMFFAFGLAFEIPIATVLLVYSGITSVESLRRKRPYIFIGCFAVGMLVTPPDVFSQTILAVPMWLLFELGLVFSKWVRPLDRDAEAEKAEDTE